MRATGRATMGVKAIDVDDTDEVVDMAVTETERSYVLAVCEKGYGKRTHIDEFRVQNRGGKGIILIDASDRNGPVVDVMLVREKDEIMVMTDRGQSLRTRAWEVRETGRNAPGSEDHGGRRRGAHRRGRAHGREPGRDRGRRRR